MAQLDKTLKRLYVVIALLGFLWLGLGVRLGYLIFRYTEASPYEGQLSRPYLRQVRGERGSILAADGTVWATSMPLFRVAVDPSAWQPKEVEDSLILLAKGLSALFPSIYPKPQGVASYLKARWKAGDRHVYLLPYRVLLTYTEQKAVAQLPLLRPARGRRALIVEKITHKRSYPYGNLARITLGYLVNDSTAWRGLESAYHNLLQGEVRDMLVRRVIGGVEIPLENLSTFEPARGADIQISLDPHLQDLVYQALSRSVEANQAKGGVAILMAVQSGRILALANYKEAYNDAVSTLWEPGSTFKVALAAALLEEKRLQPTTIIKAPEALHIADKVIRDPVGPATLSFSEALAYSHNIAFASLAQQFFGGEPRRFYRYLEVFGLLSPTQVDLPSEPRPRCIAPGSPYFNPTTLPWLAIGYNIQLTPLQLLCFYNAIANGGVWVAPRLVDFILYPEGERREPVRPPSRRIISPETALKLRDMLKATVEKGTARSIYTSLYSIAGKTGTAKKVEGGHYVNRYRAAFVGFFPAERPLYSCIVVIDEPQGGKIYGGEVAAPVFREIADAVVFRDARIAPQEPPLLAERRLPALPTLRMSDAIPLYNALSISTPKRPSTKLAKATPTAYYVDLAPLPDSSLEALVGLPLRQALAWAQEQGYFVSWRGIGPIVTECKRISARQIQLQLGYEITP